MAIIDTQDAIDNLTVAMDKLQLVAKDDFIETLALIIVSRLDKNKINELLSLIGKNKNILSYLKERREYHNNILCQTNIGSVQLTTSAISNELDRIIKHIEKLEGINKNV